MRKITLRLESLAVESFETTPPARAEGTVVGHQRTPACTFSCDSCIQTACTCPGNNTCAQSCNGTCFGYSCQAPTCVGTCATCGANTCEPTCGACTGWC